MSGLQQIWYRSLPYRTLLALRAGQRAITGRPVQIWPGSAELGKDILVGKYTFQGFGRTCEAAPWDEKESRAGDEWLEWAHGFSWLRDLAALNTREAREKARTLTTEWLDRFEQWDDLAWRGDVLGERLVHWILYHAFLTENSNELYIDRLQKSLSHQALHLEGSNPASLEGEQRLRLLRAKIYGALFLETGNPERTLSTFLAELDAQILPDGGHVSRNPSRMLSLLVIILDLEKTVTKAGLENAVRTSGVVDRMIPFLKTLCHGDHRLALFHGASESRKEIIDTIFEKCGHGQVRALTSARHSGFERIEAGKSILVIDVGMPPLPGLNRQSHASVLGLELSIGANRIFTGCGPGTGHTPDWQDAIKATPAHCSLDIDGLDNWVNGEEADISCIRRTEQGSTLLETAHGGYISRFGLMHHRQVYVSKFGDDIRLEDRVIGNGGEKATARLHLHPGCDATLLQSRNGVLIKLADGSGWHLKAAGCTLSLEDSIYTGNPGELCKTTQIVLETPLRGEGATIKWRFNRIGG